MLRAAEPSTALPLTTGADMLRGALSPRPIFEKRLAPENFPPPLLDAEEMPDGTYHILGVHHVRPSRGPSALGRVASNELLQTAVPTAVPTATPTVTPTLVPSMPPSPTPTDVPSAIPTALDHHEDEAARVFVKSTLRRSFRMLQSLCNTQRTANHANST